MATAEVRQPQSLPAETIQLVEFSNQNEQLALRTDPASTAARSVAPEEFAVLDQTPAQLRKERVRFAALLYSFFLIGWNDGSTGPLLPAIKSNYKLGFTAVSSLFIVTCLGAACGAFSIFYMLDKFGFGKVLVFGAVLQTLSYAVQIAAPPFPVFVLCSFLNGMGMAFQAISHHRLLKRC